MSLILRELLWLAGCLTVGCLLIVLPYGLPSMRTSGGWHTYSIGPSSVIEFVSIGLVLGILLMLLRYITLAISNVRQVDFRTVLLFVVYALPLSLALLYAASINEYAFEDVKTKVYPMGALEQQMLALRHAGMFADLSDLSNTDATAAVIGRSIGPSGLATPTAFVNPSLEIDPSAMLRYDRERVATHTYGFDRDEETSIRLLLTELARIAKTELSTSSIEFAYDGGRGVVLSFDDSGELPPLRLESASGQLGERNAFGGRAFLEVIVDYFNAHLLECRVADSCRRLRIIAAQSDPYVFAMNPVEAAALRELGIELRH